MRKINPKITSIVVLLMTLLLAGGVAVQETVGPGVVPAGNEGEKPGVD